MLLDELHSRDLEEAAQWAAGNYRNWSHFMWFGENDVPHPEHVCLGYLVVNVDSTIAQLTNAEIVREALDPWFGEDCENSLVGPFSSSVSGDRNVLGGIQIRVYESDGVTITPAFRRLHELVQDQYDEDHSCLDTAERYEAVNRREFIRWLAGELPSMCREHGIEYTDALPVTVYEELEMDDHHHFDDPDYWERTEGIVKALAVPA